ncbi:MAG: DUF2264 domain-containing protein [Vibrio sp.]
MRYSNTRLETKKDLLDFLQFISTSLLNQKKANTSGINVGNIVPLYGEKLSEMETFCRLLWGVIPAISSGNFQVTDSNEIFSSIALGVDPEGPEYWGNLGNFDQRCVEMAVFGVGLGLCPEVFKQNLSAESFEHLVAWLKQIRTVEMPKNNWSFFAIMVEMGLCLSGQEYSQAQIDKHFSMIDSYYLGDGWYSDGKDRPRDYYNPMAIHLYGLIYSKLMREKDPERCLVLKERASLFALDFLYMFNKNGESIPFGRSLTYRFAHVAFWSAAVFAELDCISLPVLKGLIFRNIRWWIKQDIFDENGVMMVGYAYRNHLIAEDYNAPGSSYWAMKTFLILSLEDSHPFWTVKEEPLRFNANTHIIPHANQIVTIDSLNHHYMLNAGQFPAKKYNNSESKYTKFAYSSTLGFNLERSRYGIELAGCDSALMLSECDGYFRGKVQNIWEKLFEDRIIMHWKPWNDVSIYTCLMPLADGHIRIHKINTARKLDCIEGGFPIEIDQISDLETTLPSCDSLVLNKKTQHFSSIKKLSKDDKREKEFVISPPGTNIVYPKSSVVPVLKTTLEQGEHLLVSFISAGTDVSLYEKTTINYSIENNLLIISINNNNILFDLDFNVGQTNENK